MPVFARIDGLLKRTQDGSFRSLAAIALPTGHLGRRRAVSGTRPVHHLQLRPLHRRGRYPALERALLQAARHRGVPSAPGETDGTPYQWAGHGCRVRATSTCAPTATRAAVRSWLRFRHAYPLDGRVRTWPCCIATRRSTSTCAPTISSATHLQRFLGGCRYPGRASGAVPTASLLAQPETDDYPVRNIRARAISQTPLEAADPFTRRRPAAARDRLTLERTLLDAIRDRGESPFLFLRRRGAVPGADPPERRRGCVPVLNRADRAAKQVVGHFANTLPLRIRTAPEQTVDEFLAQLREATRTPRHQKMPLGDLLRGAPLFDTTLSPCAGPPPRRDPNASVETVAQTHAMTRTRWPSGSPSSTGTATRRWISNTPAMCSPTSPWTPRRGISKPSCAPWWRRRAPPRRTRSAVGRRARGTDPHPQRHRPGIPRAGYPAHAVRRAGGTHPQRTALLEADGGAQLCRAGRRSGRGRRPARSGC